ncbi:MAG TPA: hypothetical protein VGY13_03075 [Solirubrobacteraceae bacterium]|jgi:hypothetical protein|nr:hypothetical protein [Solirubrobacteraceae bacterium]
MLHNHSKRGTPALAIAALALASLVLAACGSSSPSGTTSTSANAASAGATSGSTGTTSGTGTTSTGSGTTSTGSAGAAPGAGRRPGFAARFAAVRECLKKDGVTLPERKSGQRGSGGFLGAGGAGGPQLPAGVSRTQFEADLRKCGGFGRGRLPGAGRRFDTAAAKQALAKFAACMRADGEKLPEPNTTGKGPIFDTKGLDTTSAAFRNAERKCRTDLAGAFFARPGAAGGPVGPQPTG